MRNTKVVTLEEAIRKSGLKDGMTISFHHQQQLLAFVSHRDDMYLSNLLQIIHRLVPVEHGRQLHHHPSRLLQQFLLDLQEIRRTVGYIIGTCPMGIPSCRIQVDQVRLSHALQIGHTVVMNHFRLSKP